MNGLSAKSSFISDMDGVLYHGHKLMPGAVEFVEWLKRNDKKFLFLTNSSERSPRELHEKLVRLGIDVPRENFYTSALATATFLKTQKSGASAYVIGDAGLTNALYDVGISMNDIDPDYVVVGETRSYNYERIERAINLVLRGAKLIGTNPDLTGPIENGIAPATGSLIAPIELSTGSKAYFVGKPNPLIMRHALKHLGCRREDAVIIGDRMDTDIIAGIESEINTILVLSGVSDEHNIRKFAYKPDYIYADLKELLEKALNG